MNLVQKVSPMAVKTSPVRSSTAANRKTGIHIFCEEDGSTKSAIKKLHHRRFGSSTLRTFTGGLAAAHTAYRDSASPDLIVIETHLNGDAILAGLVELADLCSETSRLIIIGRINDVDLYRSLLNCNISDYLIAPVGSDRLASTIEAALSDLSTERCGRLIAVLGAKGGCGASTVCHNTGWALAEMAHCSTLIADFDLTFGTLGLSFNQDTGHGLSGALLSGKQPNAASIGKLVARCSDHLSLLTASYLLSEASELDPATVGEILPLLRQMADAVMLDMPSTWHDWSPVVIEEADQCVAVAEPDLANLRNAKNLIDTIRSIRPGDSSPILVMNKVGTPRRPEIAARDFGNAVELIPSLTIGFDARSFGTAANNGLMIGELQQRSHLPEQFLHLARQIMGHSEEKAERAGAAGFLKPLIETVSRKLAV